MSKDTFTKTMENSVYGVKNRDSVTFHRKPTQINRQNPLPVFDKFGVKAWVYPLSNGYFVLFRVMHSTSSAGIVCVEDNTVTNFLQGTVTDIHTRQDLVDYVKTWDKMTVFDMVQLQEDILKISLTKATSEIVN